MRLENKRAIITGASRGIGRVLALMFAAEGAQLVISARSEVELEQVRNEIASKGAVVYARTADMKDKDQIKDLVDFAAESMGGIELLVNNAGIPMFGYAIDSPGDAPEARFSDIVETNFMGYWYAARYAVPYMKIGNTGSIINISSVRGHLGLAKESAYCSAKGAIGMFSKALAVELAPHNIRVNTLSPGAIQVEAIGHWIRSRYSKEVQEEYSKRFASLFEKGMMLNQPMKRIGKSEDVGYAAIYLASDESSFVTGADIVVDGGLSCVLAEPPALDLKGLSDYYLESTSMREWLDSYEQV